MQPVGGAYFPNSSITHCLKIPTIEIKNCLYDIKRLSYTNSPGQNTSRVHGHKGLKVLYYYIHTSLMTETIIQGNNKPSHF